MSKDRVQFVLPQHFTGSSSVSAAFCKAFGRPMPTIPWCGLTIICRPSQFARFMIYRNDEGGRNGFKELKAKLIPAEEVEIIDVSKNPASGD